jgi:BNR repeat protein
MSKRGWLAVVFGVLALGAAPAAAQGALEALVTNGSPTTPFPQNKQNEPTVAIDPTNSNVVVAGSNDEIDLAPCNGNDCPFTPGVGVSGIYFSFNGGASWTQPTYQGWSARTGTPGVGPIGTLPHYYEHGLVADGDPVTAFGPRPDANGNFSWANGSRLYYSNLAANFATERKDATFKGFEAIAVSHADNLVAAANNGAGAWSDPAIVTQRSQSGTTFSDKEAIWADNAASSPKFGNAYVCYTKFKSQQETGPEQIAVSRSSDGGDTWSKPTTLTAAFDNPQHPGRQGCALRTDGNGVLYVVWEDRSQKSAVFKLARSFDAGRSFEQPRVVAQVTDVGIFDGVRSISFDGIAGARTGSFPSLDIANGAPTGAAATNKLALGWSDGAAGLNHEHALVQLSSNGGLNWTNPVQVEQASDRPNFAFIGISPNGRDLYVVYDGHTDPFRTNTTSQRRFVGVTRHANLSGTALSNLTTLDRGAVGDARASSANGLIDEFLGDYNIVAATNAGAVSVFNDARNAAVCTAINTYRQAVVNGTAGPAPAPATSCLGTFGNTDIWSAAAADPSP